MGEAAQYRCRQCDTIVPRGHRMQQCECGSVFVDWGAGGKSSCIRVGWPDGKYDDWVELLRAPDNEYDTGTPGPERPMTGIRK